MPPATKLCPSCNEEKAYTAFTIRPTGFAVQFCKPCASQRYSVWRRENRARLLVTEKNSKLKAAYGITLKEYDAMLAKQGGRCAICGTTEPCRNKKHFAVDHDHKTNKVRGLLCANCNNGLGRFKDSVEFLAAAIHYLNGEQDGDHDRAL